MLLTSARYFIGAEVYYHVGVMSDANDQVSNWSESAPFWDKHRAARRTMFEPVTAALRKAANVPDSVVEGDYHLLDVAAGAGDASLTLAVSLGPRATVWSTDLVPDMVKIAERSAAETGVQNLRCRVSRAEELPFEANTFDAVVCRFGIMFFSDPVKAVREALRVLKPGCSVGYVVWGPRVRNPFHAVVQDVLDQYVPGPAPDPDAPGAYRYAPSGKLAAIVREAGAEAVEEKPFRFNVEAPVSFDQYFELRTEMSDSLRDKLRKMPPEQRAQFKEDVRASSSRYFTASGFSIPAELLIVTGSAPR